MKTKQIIYSNSYTKPHTLIGVDLASGHKVIGGLLSGRCVKLSDQIYVCYCYSKPINKLNSKEKYRLKLIDDEFEF
jgi:hypothetical protein